MNKAPPKGATLTNSMELVALLETLARSDEPNTEGAFVKLPLTKALPGVVENMRRLERLGLLTEEVFLSIVASAPIDPHGLLRALQQHIPYWTFQPFNCTVLTVLAKVKDEPVALMQLDLVSDDIIFIARQKKQLVQVEALTADEVVAVFRRPGITPEQVWAWFSEHIAQTVRTGQEG